MSHRLCYSSPPPLSWLTTVVSPYEVPQRTRIEYEQSPWLRASLCRGDAYRKGQVQSLFDILHGESLVSLFVWRALFLFPAKILDAVVYFELYKITPRMETDPVLTALPFKRCMEVDWDKTATKDAFVHYDLRTTEVFGLDKRPVQIGEHACESGGSTKTVTLVADFVFFRTNWKRAEMGDIRRDYDDYHSLVVNL